MAAVDRTLEALEEVPIPDKITKSAPVPKLIPDEADDFARKVIEPIMHFKGNSIPVSSMPDDGRIPTNTAKLEKGEWPNWFRAGCQRIAFNAISVHLSVRMRLLDPNKFCRLISKSAS